MSDSRKRWILFGLMLVIGLGWLVYDYLVYVRYCQPVPFWLLVIWEVTILGLALWCVLLSRRVNRRKREARLHQRV